MTIPMPLVRPSLKTKRVPAVRYSGRWRKRKRTHAPACAENGMSVQGTLACCYIHNTPETLLITHMFLHEGAFNL